MGVLAKAASHAGGQKYRVRRLLSDPFWKLMFNTVVFFSALLQSLLTFLFSTSSHMHTISNLPTKFSFNIPEHFFLAISGNYENFPWPMAKFSKMGRTASPHLSNEKNAPGCLLYIGDSTTQFCGDYNKPL